MDQNIKFICHPTTFKKEFSMDAPAPLFRRHFEVERDIIKAVVSVCALGIGYLYFNGKPASDNLFCSPVSDYRKTLWMMEYDVTPLLLIGENTVAAILGNGFYNESVGSPWNFNEASWRDVPKLWFRLRLIYADRETEIASDTEWLTEYENSPVRMNELRVGEIYDARYPTDWMQPRFNDSQWVNAVIAETPGGQLRLCTAEPIREVEKFETKQIFQNEAGDWVFDFGQNMSGYVQITTAQPIGTKLTVTYAEQLNPDGTRRDNDFLRRYYDYPIGTACLICGEGETVWKPQFSYYGFRYAIVNGLVNEPAPDTLTAFFVHQDVTLHGDFSCSDEILNKIYRCSRISTLSNLFYMPTDCPTREKLGWCNDAQASAEQFIQNYDMRGFYEKWIFDLMDSVDEQGNMPGIVPTAGWGYHWGNGPVSTGVLYEIAFQMFRYTGNDHLLKIAYPSMKRHLEFYRDKIDGETGLYSYGLTDWAGPFENDEVPTPAPLTTSFIMYKMLCITALAAQRLQQNEEAVEYWKEANRVKQLLKYCYLNSCGRCTVNEQTAVALFIAFGFYDDLMPLKEQLLQTIEQHGYHFHVGMVGMQYILKALDCCNLEEIGYRLLTAKGYPSYSQWFEWDATTLFEKWEDRESRNHHMYSCVITWFRRTILGLQEDYSNPSQKIELSPYFLKELSHADGQYRIRDGVVKISWNKSGKNISYHVIFPEGVTAVFKPRNAVFEDLSAEKTVVSGENIFSLFLK